MSSILDRFLGRRLQLTFAVVALFTSNSALAQTNSDDLSQYRHTEWGVGQGFDAGRIQAIAQTPDGYLWVGTLDGLFRFDGFRFTPILTKQGQQLRQILGLSVDHEGTLWVRTADSRVVRVKDGNVSDVASWEHTALAIVAMTAAHDHGVLMADVQSRILHAVDTQVAQLPVTSTSLILAIAEASDGALWLGTPDQGLLMWNGRKLDSKSNAHVDKKINCLLPVGNGHLWVGTDDGLAYWDGHQLAPYPLRGRNTQQLQILSMMEDRRGNLWLGTSQGLLESTPTGAEWVKMPSDAKMFAVTALLEDREGDIWFGSGANLERLRSAPLLPVALGDADTKDAFGPLFVDRQKRLWFAGLNRGLSWMKDGIVHPVTIAGIADDTVYSIDGTADDVWIGRRRGGLTRLRFDHDSLTSKTWTTKDGLSENSVYVVRATPDGTVWAGTLTGGLNRYRDERILKFDERNGIPSKAISAVEVGKEGQLWIGTPTGLCVFDGRRCNTPPFLQDVAPLAVQSLLLDRAGRLLIGGLQGISTLDEHGLRTLTLPSGGGRAIIGLGLEGTGKLWLTTDHSVFSVPYEELFTSTNVDVRSYDLQQGARSGGGIRRARSVCTDIDGAVWIATEHGIFKSSSVPQSAVNPIPHVEQVLADGVPLGLGKVLVPADSRRLVIVFTGLDLRFPELLRFQYSLDSFEKAWSPVTTQRQAEYTNLPPGKYHFRLRVFNETHPLQVSESETDVEVEPTLWQRWSVRLAFAAALAILIVLAYQARTLRLLTQANLLADERLRERTRIARELHDTLLQGFISSLMHLDVASKQIPNDSHLKQKFTSVLEGMERVIEQARSAVVGLRTPDSHSLNLESDLREFFLEVSDLGSTELRVTSTGNPRPLTRFAFENICSIAREAVLNAVRHADARTVNVGIEWRFLRLTVSIDDDGCGMDSLTLDQGKPQHWGLTSMRERAKKLNASLRIKSTINVGTQVRLLVARSAAYERSRRS